MAITIYHNPRCSKSRKALEIINSRGLEPRIVRYLETPPSAVTLEELARLLGLSVADLLRTAEAEYRVATDLPAIDDDTALAGWLAAHPRVLQRPIVVDEDRGRAVLGRPPENVLDLL